jgi:hypothetical protein
VPTHVRASTRVMSAISNQYGYGASPRCSPLQQQWQTNHPMWQAINQGGTVLKYVSDKTMCGLPSDPSVLLPPAFPAQLCRELPHLIDYVQLPMYIWLPEFFFPHQVPSMLCPSRNCSGSATRQRWNPGGPRIIHGVQTAVYCTPGSTGASCVKALSVAGTATRWPSFLQLCARASSSSSPGKKV